MIYRVMQEALKNAAQHSGASRVRVSLKKEKDRIVFAVNDDGKGLQPGANPFGNATLGRFRVGEHEGKG